MNHASIASSVAGGDIRELSFVITLADSRYKIEILIVVVTSIATVLRGLEVRQSGGKQTPVQLVATTCTVLLLFMGALAVIVHRNESIANKAKDANQVAQMTQNISEIADLKHVLARAARNQETLDRKQEEEKRQASVKGGEEQRAITGLREEITVAKSEVGEANQVAEKERAARLELEAQVAPRDLSGERQQAVADGCKQFAGRSVRVVSYSLDAERARLGKQLLVSLKACGINANDKIGALTPLGGFWVGLHVSSGDIQFATALSKLLVDDGKLAVGRPRLPNGRGAWISVDNEGPSPDAVIVVGVKPVRH